MINTKTAFIIILILCLFIFPYQLSLFCCNSDLLFSMVPGWNTTIIPGQIISNVLKFLTLLISVICCWKLSKIDNQIPIRHFAIYLSLTLPALLIGKISLYELIPSNSSDPENFINHIQIIGFVNICFNVLFFIGQIIFWRFYSKKQSL